MKRTARIIAEVLAMHLYGISPEDGEPIEDCDYAASELIAALHREGLVIVSASAAIGSTIFVDTAAIVERLMDVPEGLRKGDVRLVDVLAPFGAWCSCPSEMPTEVACVQRHANGFETCGVCGGVVKAS